MLTHERILELMIYDPEVGDFLWDDIVRAKKSRWSAGTTTLKGYRQILVDGKPYLAHRLAWFYVHGKWPREQIDHINGVKNDNRLCNLREATHAQNLWNQSKRKNSKSQYKGVSWCRHMNKWVAELTANKRYFYIGSFADPKEAKAAYDKSATEIYGEFARLD